MVGAEATREVCARLDIPDVPTGGLGENMQLHGLGDLSDLAGTTTTLLLFIFIWIRGTLPRFRYDQLMGFAWKFMFPVALVNLLITALAVALTS